MCKDSLEGVFSAVYDAWKTGLGETELGIALRGCMEQELFCEYVEVEESAKKVFAVEKLIKRHLSMDAYWNIYHAVLSNDAKKGDAILGTMLAAKSISDSRKIMNHLSHPQVRRVFELGRKVSNEAHYYVEFVRFAELENGILFSEIEPKAQVLTCIANHFASRFPLENWLIYDKTHKSFLVHEAKKQWILVVDEELTVDVSTQKSRAEARYVKLWKTFFESVSIRERESYERQRQHLPLHFRNHMTEFESTCKDNENHL